MTSPAPALTVDVGSPVPPYEQIRSQVAAHVAAGLLAPGTRLPTMRALAADLGIAVGTVARAYAELEAAGVVASRRRTGTVVTAAAITASEPPSDRLRTAADRLAREGRAAGLDGDAVLALLRAAWLRSAAPS